MLVMGTESKMAVEKELNIPLIQKYHYFKYWLSGVYKQ